MWTLADQAHGTWDDPPPVAGGGVRGALPFSGRNSRHELVLVGKGPRTHPYVARSAGFAATHSALASMHSAFTSTYGGFPCGDPRTSAFLPGQPVA